MRRLAFLVAFSSASFLLGCSTKVPPLPTAEIGVFYGGQVQRAEHLEVSRVRRPKLGFRVDLPEGTPPRPITFEVVRPGPAGRRVTKKGTIELEAGQTRLDHVLDWDAEERLGIWNVRVVYGDLLLADRALYLTPERARSARDP